MATGALVATAVIFAGARAMADQSSGDPGAERLRRLEPVVGALPSDARIVYRHDVEPHMDSCDGRAGTFGWSQVVVQVHFSTATPRSQVAVHAEQVLSKLGWQLATGSRADDLGVDLRWTKPLDRGATAVTALEDQDADGRWTLIALAPPRGTAASGC